MAARPKIRHDRKDRVEGSRIVCRRAGNKGRRFTHGGIFGNRIPVEEESRAVGQSIGKIHDFTSGDCSVDVIISWVKVVREIDLIEPRDLNVFINDLLTASSTSWGIDDLEPQPNHGPPIKVPLTIAAPIGITNLVIVTTRPGPRNGLQHAVFRFASVRVSK